MNEPLHSVMLHLADQAEGETAVEILLGLVRGEADALLATTEGKIEDSMRSTARIELLLNKAVDYQASMDEWLNAAATEAARTVHPFGSR